MKRTIILIAVLFIAVFVVAGLYFSRLEGSKMEAKDDLAAIPADATLLLSFRNDSSLYDLFQDYRGFEMVLGKAGYAELGTLKKIFRGRPEWIALLADQPIYMSFHPEPGEVAWLISVPLKEEIDPLQEAGTMDSLMTMVSLDASRGFYELTVPGIDRPLFGSIEPNRISLSFSRDLLERALDGTAPRLSALFLEKFQENSDLNNSPVQLYINHEPLEFLIGAVARNQNATTQLFSNLDGLTLMGINYKSDVLMFSGSSIISSTDSSYLSLLIEQEPVQHQLKNWIPDNVAVVSSYGISDYGKFRSGLSDIFANRQETAPLTEQIRYIESNQDISIEDEYLPIWGSEFARLRLRSGEEIAVVAVRDSLEYSKVADKLSTLSTDSSYRRFDNSNLLYYALGDPMKEFKRPYFTYSRGYVVVANSLDALDNYMDRIKRNELLVNDEDYQLYDRLQSASSNYSLFIHQENASRLISRNLREPMRQNYNNTSNFAFQDFYAFTLQLSGNGDRFSVNLYGKFLTESSFPDNKKATDSVKTR